MVAPMRPWQNALAIAAGFLVAGSLLPWSLRLVCALGAIAIVLILAIIRLRGHARELRKTGTTDVYERLQKIRSDRRARFRGRNR